MVPRLIGWLDERLDLSDIRHFIAEKGVPIHTQEIWYYLGGMTLFLFAGPGRHRHPAAALLPAERRSKPTRASSSSSRRCEFGWLIRNLHSWSANLLIAAAFAHFFSVFFLKSYRKPRELTWVSGMLLLFLMLAFGFSGYLLPWNELSFFATKVGTGIAGAVPVVGRLSVAPAARRRRRDRRDAVALLRPARRHPADAHHGARRRCTCSSSSARA